MDDLQAEVPFKRIEIAVSVKQNVTAPQAEGCDQAIDRLPYGLAPLTQGSVVARRRRRKPETSGLEDLEPTQLAEYVGGLFVSGQPLQDFAHDEVEDTQPLLGQLRIEPVGLRSTDAIEKVDPDARVDDNHASPAEWHPTQSARREITLPANLAAQTSDARLRLGSHEQAERSLDGRTLGTFAAHSQRLAHQGVVDLDIGPHVVPSNV